MPRQRNSSELIQIVHTVGVLAGECERIWPDEPRPTTLKQYYDIAQNNDQAALCLSGGGIRSASFALGVLQAFARKGLLTDFHYLSTVSGGGYIGGWLQRWMHEKGWSATRVMEHLAIGCTDACEEAAAEAEDRKPKAKGAKAAAPAGTIAEQTESKREPKQIRALRENSNFITPRVGISSNDTWTAISISARNIAVNWLLFAPLFLLVAIVPNIFTAMINWVGAAAGRYGEVIYLPFGLSLLCAVVAAWHTCRALPSYRPVHSLDGKVEGAGDGWLLARVVKWLVLWAMFGTMTLWVGVLGSIPAASSSVGLATFAMTNLSGWPHFVTSGLGFALASMLIALASLTLSGALLPRGAKKETNYRGAFWGDLWVWTVAFATAALTIPVGLALFSYYAGDAGPGWKLALFATLGPLWLMGSQLMIAFVFAAFRKSRGAPVNADADREWIARLSAVKVKQMLLWGLLALTSLILVRLIQKGISTGQLSISTLVAAASGGIAVFGGRAESSGNTTSGVSATIMRFLPLAAVVSIATFIFVIALLTFFGAAEQAAAARVVELFDPLIEWLRNGLNDRFGLHLREKWLDRGVLGHVELGILLVIALLFFNRRIPVNRFSLNGLYRNRLSRAFLGGARDVRVPDPFTGFDPNDNVDLSQLDPQVPIVRTEEACPPAPDPDAAPRPAARSVLYPVVNVALNVTATTKLAWQERKAEPFVLTPLYCGSAMLVPEEGTIVTEPARPPAADPDDPPGAYVCSHCYGGSEPGDGIPKSGISLATAIAISGAAASPNMGYHSSPATAFLMTLFNLRLGQWMPNPARAKSLGDKVFRSNPTSSLRALLRELAGSTDDQGFDIYLSDGGHFENLALYEMIRRRCKYIVVSDAGADPDCDFTDLGNAVRKVKIDLGADISFRKMRISSRGKPIGGQVAWAFGCIDYGDGQSGQILYIKPSYFEANLPVDLVSYAAASGTFPHESTGDQFFSESQFESYRKLGYTFASRIGGDADFDTIKALFDGLDASARHDDGEDHKLKDRFMTWLRGLSG
jgi:hypothetical protein